MIIFNAVSQKFITKNFANDIVLAKLFFLHNIPSSEDMKILQALHRMHIPSIMGKIVSLSDCQKS